MSWIKKQKWLIATLWFLVCACPCFADLASETVYLTWQDHPESTMTIQWITESDQENNAILYRLHQEGEEWKEVAGYHIFFPYSSRYFIHRVQLTELEPNTVYNFKLALGEEDYLFRTMPLTNEQPVRFVIGGDMYHDEIEFCEETCLQAIKSDPHFAIVGGDIAYAVGNLNSKPNVSKWIEWLRTWNACMMTKEGRLIPVVAAVGNHDVVGQFNQTFKQASIFLELFPRVTGKTYTVMDFGSYLGLIILDSGHASSVKDSQLEWLKSALERCREKPHRFAIYHVPAYPSVRSFKDKLSASIRKHWVPLFEENGIQLVFEHHDHAYKRTHPLINDKVNPKGVIYLGDGAWGVKNPRRPRFNRKAFYVAKQAAIRHFMLVTLEQHQQRVISVNDRGQIIDSLTLPLANEASVNLKVQ